MSRNGSGVYSLPVAPFTPGTTISSSDVNSDFSDIATALTGSIAADGQTAITGQLKGALGTAPTYSISGDLNTGFGSSTADTVFIQCGGANVVSCTATTATILALSVTNNAAVTGVLSVTGNVLVNTNKFTIDASNGNTSIAGAVSITGTAAITGSVAVNTNKFTVDASNGNTVAAGTIGGTSITASAALSGATAAGAMLASQAEQETGSATNKVVQPGVQQYHPSACKAWAKFTTGASPSVSAGYNVSSVSRNATGVYVVNFTTAFSSNNYCVNVSADRSSSLGGYIATYSIVSGSQVVVVTVDVSAVAVNPNSVSISCWGDQ